MKRVHTVRTVYVLCPVDIMTTPNILVFLYCSFDNYVPMVHHSYSIVVYVHPIL